MGNFYKFLPGLLLPLAVACSDDAEPKPETIPSVSLNSISSAVYDDTAGSYAVTLTGDDVTLQLQFAAQPEALALSTPVPQTGSYQTGVSDAVYAVDAASSWTDSAGAHPIADAQIAVVSSGENCSLSGSLVGSDATVLNFRAANVQFTHSVTASLALTEAAGTAEDGVCTLRFEGASGRVEFAIAVSGVDPENPAIPDGTYRPAAGSCSWSDAGTDYEASEAFCRIVRADGGYRVVGVLASAAGNRTRFAYDGAILFGDAAAPYLYTKLGGAWTMTTDRWLVYDKSSKTWVFSDTGDTDAMSMNGIPQYHCLLATGLFDDSFCMLFGLDDGGLFIPSSVESNPVAQVVSGSGTYYLFATLYDPETGYFLSGGNVAMELAADLSQFTMVAQTSEVTDSETGDKIQVNYSYFGLVGKNTSSGKYTKFSNWPFLHLPQYSRPGANTPALAPASASRMAKMPVTEKVTCTISEEEILQIIPMTPNL